MDIKQFIESLTNILNESKQTDNITKEVLLEALETLLDDAFGVEEHHQFKEDDPLTWLRKLKEKRKEEYAMEASQGTGSDPGTGIWGGDSGN
jgi:hypothetical protein